MHGRWRKRQEEAGQSRRHGGRTRTIHRLLLHSLSVPSRFFLCVSGSEKQNLISGEREAETAAHTEKERKGERQQDTESATAVAVAAAERNQESKGKKDGESNSLQELMRNHISFAILPISRSARDRRSERKKSDCERSRTE